ncbi:hypothetical protein B0A49_01864 [Cryomyces minteri]|uniref:Uncharacterized protein n=1 Tax=Cryomyces minteri TaxID=331657 RepID=A0A4U0XM77_9PEZI|nr:hypothetical protein B0A49_01864 [Cryomyces minteri]
MAGDTELWLSGEARGCIVKREVSTLEPYLVPETPLNAMVRERRPELAALQIMEPGNSSVSVYGLQATSVCVCVCVCVSERERERERERKVLYYTKRVTLRICGIVEATEQGRCTLPPPGPNQATGPVHIL